MSITRCCATVLLVLASILPIASVAFPDGAVASSAANDPKPTISVSDGVTGAPAFGSLKVDGSVFDAEPDGDGGFLIGGDFTCVGPSAGESPGSSPCLAPNTPASGLARIRADREAETRFASLGSSLR